MDPNQDLLTLRLRDIIPTPSGRLFVGVAIHKLIGQRLTILLMRRGFFPPDRHKWEIPAGEVEATDNNVREAISRIVYEQTGLGVYYIEDELSSLNLSDDQRYLVIQINFRVRVAAELETRVIAECNENDYMEAAWLTRGEIDDYDVRMRPAMDELIDEAFEACIEAEL